MDLTDFIAVTLDQIMDGVTKAPKAHRDSGRRGFINPMDGQQGDTFDSIPIFEVRFDVAVTVESSKSKSRTGGINIEGVGSSIRWRRWRKVRWRVKGKLHSSRLLADNEVDLMPG